MNRKDSVKQLLQDYYHLDGIAIPAPQQRANFTKQNKLGFFLGVVEVGQAIHLEKLYTHLTGNNFEMEQSHSTDTQLHNPNHARTFFDRMFEYYIGPFHSAFKLTCHTESNSSQISVNDACDTHVQFKKDVCARDGCCVFCWMADPVCMQSAHIIAQNPLSFSFEPSSILSRAGLEHVHQVQNGLLLCSNCHLQFDALQRYVDWIDDTMVVKVVNQSNDNSETHKQWVKSVWILKNARLVREEDWTDHRQSIDSNGEMHLYFVNDNPLLQPNRNALEFHRAACLIWKMAGGACRDYECCDDDELVDPMRAIYDANVTDWVATQKLSEYVKDPGNDSGF